MDLVYKGVFLPLFLGVPKLLLFFFITTIDLEILVIVGSMIILYIAILLTGNICSVLLVLQPPE